MSDLTPTRETLFDHVRNAFKYDVLVLETCAGILSPDLPADSSVPVPTGDSSKGSPGADQLCIVYTDENGEPTGLATLEVYLTEVDDFPVEDLEDFDDRLASLKALGFDAMVVHHADNSEADVYSFPHAEDEIP